jgi:hypothetical protein
MQPVRGTLPPDRRKSCLALAGPGQPLGSGSLGVSTFRGAAAKALCPSSVPEQEPPSLAPSPPKALLLPGGVGSSDAINRNCEEAGGLFCIDFKTPVNNPPLWPDPDG